MIFNFQFLWDYDNAVGLKMAGVTFLFWYKHTFSNKTVHANTCQICAEYIHTTLILCISLEMCTHIHTCIKKRKRKKITANACSHLVVHF